MREVSGPGIRGSFFSGGARGCLFALLVLALFGARETHAQAITRFVRDTGNINFVTTGGSLRTQDNTGNSCAMGTTSSQNLSGIPLGTTIRNAYLYWGGSGSTADTAVTLNGSAVTASRTFARTWVNGGNNYPFFGGFANVTSLVTGNGNFTFGDLTVNTGTPFSGNSTCAGGWALIVIYESPTERLRAINVFDGLDYFYGSQLTLTPDGYRVPSTNIDGRIAVFTLDGDPGNSTTNNGFDEALRFNTNLLDDGIVVPNSVPTVQQFDGTINTQGISTSYGVDVDQYDISAYLTPGQTSGTTQYSAGADLVLLMAQIVSATSDPAVDLSVVKSHTGNFVSGGTGTYTITVSNAAGMEREDNTVTVVDTLPAGLTFNSFTGTGWSCAAVAQVVTCTHAPTLNAGASFPPLNIVVNVAQSAAASVTNSVTVTSPSFDLNAANNTDTDPTTTIDPNLSTSTKSVVDLNGGEASPGDTLRYTITLTESAGGQAVNVTVTDHIPDNASFGGFVSVPAGATSSFTAPPAGNNANGFITVSGITVPASGSVTLVFDVTVPPGTSPGETIDNTAIVNNPNGAENNPASPQVVVNPSLIPSAGTKFLYLRQLAGVQTLSRTVPGATDQDETIDPAETETWNITPALQQTFSIASGGIPVRLWLNRSGGGGGTSRNFTLTLTSSSGFTSTVTASVTIGSTTTPSQETFTIPNAAARTFPAGTTFTLTVRNNSGNAVTLFHDGDGGAGNNSRIEFAATTVINVDSVTTWNAAFNGGATQTTFYPGATVFVRAQVSDPFGSFDISAARITIIDPSNVTQVNNVLMTAQGAPATCNSQAAASCIYQYAYTVPASPSLGGWTVRVTANEGTEGTVTDLGVGNFTVVIPQPTITMVKTSTVLSDPVNNTTNPKRIPNAVVRYDITLTNSGPGTVDSGTLVLTDPIPANSAMYVSSASGDPVVFINGATVSGLTYNYATHVTYSSTGASGPWTYTPMPDANGFDPAVRAVRIAPTGVMNAASGGNPSFTIQFRVRIN
jgi:trimeric autotransporter adhesin